MLEIRHVDLQMWRARLKAPARALLRTCQKLEWGLVRFIVVEIFVPHGSNVWPRIVGAVQED